MSSDIEKQTKAALKEYKKTHANSPRTASNADSVSARVTNNSSSGTTSLNASYHHNISQENESLEEDMRKAKESADMLRSVVLPLETEINVLRSRSNTSDSRIRELEGIIEEVRLY